MKNAVNGRVQTTRSASQLPLNLNTGTRTNSIIWSIGHSTKSADELLERLNTYGIGRVVDVRTHPYSRWCPQHNRGQLSHFLAQHDINYDWRGLNLGGKAENVDYDVTLQELVSLADNEHIVILCSEGSYKKCHRYTMLTPDLERLGVSVAHIDYD
jgi:uncharacterized protein (DUF488 family)